MTTSEDGIESCTEVPKPTTPPTPSPEDEENEEGDDEEVEKETEKAGPHKGKF